MSRKNLMIMLANSLLVLRKTQDTCKNTHKLFSSQFFVLSFCRSVTSISGSGII
jgi:hypothetical protein